jgi:molecular chaperone DnaK (HSP70)
MPQVEVTFDVDSNGILSVKAKDKATGKEQSIRIEASSGLTPDDIERMKKDAEIHADEDAKKKELVDVKNTAEMIIFSAEKALQEHGANIPEEIMTAVTETITAAKSAKDTGDKAAIETATNELSIEMQKIGEHINKNAQQSAADGATGTAPEGEVKDAKGEETA